ncbi:MAG: DUF4097 family beta strand repeat-containing protein [bacterium]
MNERMKILELLEKGKITAQEAEKLLDAIREPEKGKKRGFWNIFEFVPEMVGSIFDISLNRFNTNERLEVPFKKRIEISGVGGDVEVIGADAMNIVIEKEGLAKVSDEGDILRIKTLSGDMKVHTPRKIDLAFRSISGDLKLENIIGKIEISSVSGDIDGKRLSGTFIAEVVSSDIELEYETIDRIYIKSRSGDIELYINKDAEVQIDALSEIGSVECEIPLQNVNQKSNYIKGILNAPKGRIEIKNSNGDVVIKARR